MRYEHGPVTLTLALARDTATPALWDATMTTLDDLWFLADEANQRAEQAYHRLRRRYDEFMERSLDRRVSRRRFRTLARRVKETGAPFGAHTIVYRENGDLLLCRHEGVDLWVLPGGGVDDGETYAEAARRELHEEAGLTVDYDGLAMANRVQIRCDAYETWGVLPVFAAEAVTETPTVTDPDDEISRARWFDDLPEDTRDRTDLEAWRRRQSFG
jgi:8-oxo-dGTP diphosphatase